MNSQEELEHDVLAPACVAGSGDDLFAVLVASPLASGQVCTLQRIC